jgi:glyoxylase-like metal-dependent hydrolase (beta-lactamase superfamily II)
LRIISIKGRNHVYTSNVYLVMGDWRRLEDPNTLIDVGTDPTVLEVLEDLDTGVGKKKVEQVILTHSHSDHCAILSLIRKTYDPVIYAFSPYLAGVDRVLQNGDVLRVGDGCAKVVQTPGHSEDSICLLFTEERVLFTGDVNLGPNPEAWPVPDALRPLIPRERLKVFSIFSGHDRPRLNPARRVDYAERFGRAKRHGKEDRIHS